MQRVDPHQDHSFREQADGAILWNGEPVRDPAAWFRYPVRTYVLQEPHLFSASIRDNVVLEPGAGTDGSAEAVDAALQAAARWRTCRTAPRRCQNRRNEAVRRPALAAGVGARSSTAPRWWCWTTHAALSTPPPNESTCATSGARLLPAPCAWSAAPARRCSAPPTAS